MVTTEAWVLYKGREWTKPTEHAILKKEAYSFENITEHEALVEPIYGCWEGNMSHAIQRDPIDICQQRGEEKVVIGNAGIVRVLKIGSAVTTARVGDICLYLAMGTIDQYGYMIKVAGYDAPGTIGLLAKQTKVRQDQLLPLSPQTRFSPLQWAAFSLRYVTAWSNWKVVYRCWRSQMTEDDQPFPYVWGWGGGVTLAELALAKTVGAQLFMIASQADRLKLLQESGITPIDRHSFRHLDFDEERYLTDSTYKKNYQEAERTFLDVVQQHTSGAGASIFIDNIGMPVFRATLKALGRQGVITTAGWKKGMSLSQVRALECINRHIHVHTHGWTYAEAAAAVQFAEENGWMPPITDEIYGWNDVPQLAHDFTHEKCSSYFPIYQVNTL
jgi:NADPH:quinone reductase-like Zn-dependent oxidoreductase